ncbi:MAG: sporulation protein YunB [Turicibacter sp.]|nr:sporulation protein YunB [Turicibacter sp.]
MTRKGRRRSNKRKRKSSFLKKLKRRLIAVSILVGLGYGTYFVYHNIYALVLSYASKQTINIATLIIKEAIGNSELVSFAVEDVISFKENEEGYVSSVYINTPLLNRLLVSATQQVEEKLLLVESGDLSELGLDAIYGGPYEEGVLTSVPLTAALNLSLFHEYGPSFPVSAKLIGNAETDIETAVQPYGINNAMLEISLKVTVRLKVSLPFKSEESTITVKSPIVIKMVTGQTPEYYYIGNTTNSTTPLSPFSKESGGTVEGKTPSLSPDQSVKNGMENILLE